MIHRARSVRARADGNAFVGSRVVWAGGVGAAAARAPARGGGDARAPHRGARWVFEHQVQGSKPLGLGFLVFRNLVPHAQAHFRRVLGFERGPLAEHLRSAAGKRIRDGGHRDALRFRVFAHPLQPRLIRRELEVRDVRLGVAAVLQERRAAAKRRARLIGVSEGSRACQSRSREEDEPTFGTAHAVCEKREKARRDLVACVHLRASFRASRRVPLPPWSRRWTRRHRRRHAPTSRTSSRPARVRGCD